MRLCVQIQRKIKFKIPETFWSNWPPTIFLGASHPKPWKTRIPGFSFVWWALSTVPKWRRSASPFSRNFWGKFFFFSAPSGKTANCSWRGNQSSVKLDSKFRSENFFAVFWSAAEIFEVKRNSNFPVQNMKIWYARPRLLLLQKTLSTESYN